MQTPSLVSLLYVSRIAPGLDEGRTVATITRQARTHNAIAGVSGVLVFDGESFAQLVEGVSPTIAALRDRILQDDRHRDAKVLWFGASGAEREYPGWDLGYVLADEDGGIRIESLRELDGEVALDAFRTLVRSLDTGVSSGTVT